MVLSLCGNLVHRFSHESNPHAIVQFLQNIHILQQPAHHKRHHYITAADGSLTQTVKDSDSGTHYCTIGNYLNLVLDKTLFWRKLENAIEKFFGIQPLYKQQQLLATLPMQPKQ
jgi:hypothetical protein